MLKRRTLAWVGIIAFMICLVMFMPASVIVGRVIPVSVLQYGAVEGSLWSVTLSRTRAFGVSLGTLEAEPNVISLISGGFSGPVRLRGGTVEGHARAHIASGVTLSEANFVSEVKTRFLNQQVAGVIAVQNGALTMAADGRCETASGQVRSSLLESLFATQNLAGAPLLLGTLGCVDGLLVADLSGRSDLLTFEGQAVFQGLAGVSISYILAFPQEDALPASLISALQSAGLTATDEGWRGQLQLDI